MGKVKDLTGQRFGKLVVIEQSGFVTDNNSGLRSAVWKCKCDCGKETNVRGANLTRRTTNSCGCLKSGHKGTRIRGKYTSCTKCGSDKHYAKGLCRNCYEKNRLYNIRHENEILNKEEIV